MRRFQLALLVAIAALACLIWSSVAHAQVLYDQLGATAEAEGLFSENFASPDDAFDAQAADDFRVSRSREWTIRQVQVAGVSTGDAPSLVNVTISESVGSVPSRELFRESSIMAMPPDYVIPLTGAPALLSKRQYWISVQAEGGRYSGVRAAWLWKVRGPVSGSPAIYENPGGGFPGCPSWGSGPSCNQTKLPDLAFRLSGKSVPDNHFRLREVVRNRRRGIGVLPVVVPGPGTLKLVGPHVIEQRQHVRAGEIGRLRVIPKGAKKKTLEETGDVSVRVRVTFTPTGGEPRGRVTTMRLAKHVRASSGARSRGVGSRSMTQPRERLGNERLEIRTLGDFRGPSLT